MQGQMGKTNKNFTLSFNEDENLFHAMISTSEDHPEKLSSVAVSRSLVDLLTQCRELGLKHLVEMDEASIGEVLQWLQYRPAFDYVEELWNGDSDLTKKGPMGTIGFIKPTT